MGLEAKADARKDRKSFRGTLYLDSKQLTFKSAEFRWSAKLGEATHASAQREKLTVVCGSEKLTFALDGNLSSWAEKINNPPTRATKLGIKPEHKFWLSKGFTKPFADELKSVGSSATRKIETCDIAFWKVTHREQLKEFKTLTSQLPEATNLWIVWTKGSEAISKSEVMSTAKKFNFGPSKTAAFDEHHSSMRYRKKA
jgi:hypothetical protein